MHPADLRGQLARHDRRVLRIGEHVAPADVELTVEPDRDRHRRHGRLERTVEALDRLDTRAPPRGEHDDLVARPPDTPRDRTAVAAIVVVARRHWPDDPLDGEAPLLEHAPGGELDALEVLEQRRPAVPGHRRPGLDDVLAVEGRERNGVQILQAEPLCEHVELGLDLHEAPGRVVDQVHLVHGHDDVRDGEQRGDVGVAARLLDDAAAGVEKDDRDVGRRGAGDHVARVLDMPGCVCEQEPPARGHERAVGNVDRDALLALGLSRR